MPGLKGKPATVSAEAGLTEGCSCAGCCGDCW